MIGLCVGEGVLSMDTMDCKLAVGGISILSIGLAGGPFKSTAENLKDPADFEDTSPFADLGRAYIVRGERFARSNAKGVEIQVHGLEIEAELLIGPKCEASSLHRDEKSAKCRLGRALADFCNTASK